MISMLGITVGYHRLFTHRAFKCVSGIRMLLAIFGSMAGQGPLLAWVDQTKGDRRWNAMDAKMAFRKATEVTLYVRENHTKKLGEKFGGNCGGNS
jgi:hypothetical protein